MQQNNKAHPANAYEVASGIARWAISKGLMESLPVEVDNHYLASVDEIPFSADAERILRQKEIQSIAYNNDSHTVYIYTKRKVTQKDLDTLSTNRFQNSIVYPQGQLDVVGKAAAHSQGASYAIHQSAPGKDHYTCGSSISPGNDASAGTMGCLISIGDGKLYGLTNNHVSALCSHVPIGMPILAPGVADVMPNSQPPFTIGFHRKALEMKVGSVDNVDISSNLDAAIFEINNHNLVSSMQGAAFDTPAAIIAPEDGMRVAKVGRTTGHTVGRIVGKELRPTGVTYQASTYGFNGMLRFSEVFIIHGDGSQFSSSGDSGSLVVQVDEKGQPLAAVGLIFAGGPDSMAPGGARSLMLPLSPIMAAFGGAQIVGGYNV